MSTIATLPTEITSIAEARDALLQYVQTLPNPRIGAHTDLAPAVGRALLAPFDVTAQRLRELQAHPDKPGPVVRAVRESGGKPFLVGHDAAPPGRAVVAVTVPDGPIPPRSNVAVALVAATADAGVVLALGARLDALAEANRGGRNRQIGRLRAESSALATLADELITCVVDLGDVFLAMWAESHYRRHGPPPPPPARAINLR